MNLPKSKLTRSQFKTYAQKEIDYHGTKADIIVKIRYDDECSNGHNTFTITADTYKRSGRRESAYLAGGCCHDEIIKHFPELKRAIDFHLTSSDGPLHYVANAMYHAKEVKPNTVPRFYDHRLMFFDCPFTFKLNKRLKAFIDSYTFGDNIEVVALTHPRNHIKGEYQYSDNYTFKGLELDWYKSLFTERREAEEMAQAIMSMPFTIEQFVSSYQDEKIPDLEAARNCAIWNDAELEDFTEEKLNARLPVLMQEFKQIVESFGFEY